MVLNCEGGDLITHELFGDISYPNRFTNVKQDEKLRCEDSRQQKRVEGAEQREFKKGVIDSMILDATSKSAHAKLCARTRAALTIGRVLASCCPSVVR